MARLPLTLQTRLGRRIALLFVVSALLPLGVMAVQGYAQVRSRLIEQFTSQVEQGARDAGMGVLAQLDNAENLLLAMSRSPEPAANAGRSAAGDVSVEDHARGTFSALAMVTKRGTRAMWGRVPEGGLTSAQETRVAAGRAVLRVDSTGHVWLVSPAPAGAQLWGELDSTYLFSGALSRAGLASVRARLCIRATDPGVRLLCPPGSPGGQQMQDSWDLFLNYDFGSPPWRVELSAPLADVLAPVAAFRRTFGLSVIVVVALVVLLTSVQVRRSLEPLTELRKGMQRVAARDFSGGVTVSSGDEFEELAHAFNRMTGEIDQQFRAITAGSAIDQAALVSRRGVDVATEAATRLRNALRSRRVDVFVAGERPGDPWWRIRGADDGSHAMAAFQPPVEDLERLRASASPQLDSGDGWPDWLRAPEGGGLPDAVLPLVSHGELVGLISLQTDGPASEAQLRVARQLGDQLSVGLANSRLIARLNGLSYGALSALARTVDANSHWTAGHSERVTALSMRIARQLRMPSGELDTLYRGGLLHDIGKIGVPSHVLNFAGPLDKDGYAAIRRHPDLGAEILAPIAAFADAIPIVRSHHERMDGSGYPEGLVGENIPPFARLLAVADVYDALVSQRPYRAGWHPEKAIERIRQLAGTHFDRVMVEAFLTVMRVDGDAARFAVDPISLQGVAT